MSKISGIKLEASFDFSFGLQVPEEEFNGEFLLRHALLSTEKGHASMTSFRILFTTPFVSLNHVSLIINGEQVMSSSTNEAEYRAQCAQLGKPVSQQGFALFVVQAASGITINY